jgi:hypothetical protein
MDQCEIMSLGIQEKTLPSARNKSIGFINSFLFKNNFGHFVVLFATFVTERFDTCKPATSIGE